MGRILKRIGIGLLVLVALLVVVVGGLHGLGSSRLAKAPGVAGKPVAVPTDAAALARGEHIAQAVSACAGCHGGNFEGTIFQDGPPLGYVPAPNLTAGAGGVGAEYSDEEWERAIRHGVARDGRVMGLMPNQAYANLSDSDTGALIAYLKQVPPVDNELGPRRIAFPGTLIFGVLAYNTLPIATIAHANVGGLTAGPGETAAGEYLATVAGCHECHGSALAGLTDPNGPPPGPNLTPSGVMADWSEEDFFTTIRTGTDPSGHELSEEMPWMHYKDMSDEELHAIWAYLEALPARELGQNE